MVMDQDTEVMVLDMEATVLDMEVMEVMVWDMVVLDQVLDSDMTVMVWATEAIFRILCNVS